MNKGLYGMYKETKKLLEKAKEREVGDKAFYDMAKEIFDEWSVTVKKMEESNPEFFGQYESEKLMQQSFTSEQKDFIDWQINNWHLEWRNRILSEKGREKLEVAKDQLKIMIYGD